MTREEYVKYMIKENGYTLKDYAKLIGMPYSSLLSMLAGNLDGTSLENVIKICGGLGINLANLQKRDGIEPDENWALTDHEKDILRNYRTKVHMQTAVNKLLDVDLDDD